MNRVLRVLAGAGALGLGVALVYRTSGDPIVAERYSFEYAAVLLCYVPLFLALAYLALRGKDVKNGLLQTIRSPVFWITLVLCALPAVAVAARYAETGDVDDPKRVVGLVFLSLAFATASVGVASRGGGGGRHFRLGALSLVGAVYLATFLATPLLGGWVERRMGLGGTSTFDVIRPSEAKGLWQLMHQPGAEFVYPGQPGQVREFSVPVRNNSWGFHDNERTFQNPDGRKRVVVVGDTYVQALEVPMERGFPALLERMLQDDGADAYEVVRIARRSIGQTEELELIREFVPRLGPDLVILVWATNDLLDNDPSLRALEMRLPGVLLFPGLLVDRLAALWLRARTYVVDERLQLAVLRPDHWAYLEPMPAPVRDAMSRTEGMLDEIIEEVQAAGSQFMLVIKRPTNEVRWLRRYPGLRAYELNPGVYDEWLSAYAASRGVHYLDTGAPFQEYYDVYPTGHPEQFSWPHGGFWREPGHRLAAQLIYDYMVANGLATSTLTTSAASP